MRELTECLNTKRKIDKVDDEITELKAKIHSPKNQVITGMPRGGTNENAIERYLIKLEKKEQYKTALLKYQSEQWKNAMQKIPNIEEQVKHLLYIRFMQGLPWKKCANKMNEQYGNWNIGKVFRIYGKINQIL